MTETYQGYHPERNPQPEGWSHEQIEDRYMEWLNAGISVIADDQAKRGDAVRIVLKRPNDSDKWLPPGMDCPPDADTVVGLREEMFAEALDAFGLVNTDNPKTTKGRVHTYGQDYDEIYDEDGPVMVTRRQTFRGEDKTQLTADVLFLERK